MKMQRKTYYYITLYIWMAIVGVICIQKVATFLPASMQEEIVLEKEVSTEINGIDPASSKFLATSEAIAKIYEGLLEYHYLKRPAELIPNLATEMPKISEDRCVYTFTIKSGIFFQNDICFPHSKGRELIAEDFVYSIKRIADPKTQCGHFSLIENKIKGLDSWREKCRNSLQSNYKETIEGVKSINKYTLQFTLNKPCPQFLYLLAMPFLYVLPKEAVLHYGNRFPRHPVGTGPFMLKQFGKTKVVFVKNPTFREKYFPSEATPQYQHMLAYAGKKLPFVDKVITHYTEEYPSWLAFEKGKLDILHIHHKTIALHAISDGVLSPKLKKKGIKLFSEPGAHSFYFAFNNNNKLLQYNKKLRQAIWMAFDATSYNNTFFGGMAAVTYSFLPPTLADTPQNITGCRYNLQKAKQYLAEAGYPNGKNFPVLTLRTQIGKSYKEQAEFFAKCMKHIGIQVKIITCINWYEFVNSNTMMTGFQWYTEYPDAQSFFSLLYTGPGSYYGVGLHFFNTEYNRLYEKAFWVKNLSERMVLYHKMNQIIDECMPMIYALHTPYQVLHQGWVKNYIYNSYSFGIEQYIAIDTTLKNTLLKN